jgi:hypothetical protein
MNKYTSQKNVSYGVMPKFIFQREDIMRFSDENKNIDEKYLTYDTVKAAQIAIATTAIAFPPLILLNIVMGTALTLTYMSAKQNELHNVSALILNMINNMNEDMTKMLLFYANDNTDTTPNPIFKTVLMKIGDLTCSILDTLETDSFEKVAAGFEIYTFFDKYPTTEEKKERLTHILQNFRKEKHAKKDAENKFKNEERIKQPFNTLGNKPPTRSGVGWSILNKNNEDIEHYDNFINYFFGEDGKEFIWCKRDIKNCNKTTDDKTFSTTSYNILCKIKYTLLNRLCKEKLDHGILNRKKIQNFTSSYEKYRQLIRDITIVGLFYSQASTKFLIDMSSRIRDFEIFKKDFDDKNKETIATMENNNNITDSVNDNSLLINSKKNDPNKNDPNENDPNENNLPGGNYTRKIKKQSKKHTKREYQYI